MDFTSSARLTDSRPVPLRTTASVCAAVLHYDPRNFSDPSVFMPERWLGDNNCHMDPHFNHEPSAFIPFSVGQANCIGRAIALQEIRMTLASLVRQFDISFAPGWDQGVWLESLREMMVLRGGALNVNVNARL